MFQFSGAKLIFQCPDIPVSGTNSGSCALIYQFSGSNALMAQFSGAKLMFQCPDIPVSGTNSGSCALIYQFSGAKPMFQCPAPVFWCKTHAPIP
jgi:hypothetical protein